MSRHILQIAVISMSLISLSQMMSSTHADDGMFPMSELPRLDLAAKGIELTADQLFNPDQISLVDGICRVNGCTGSFVSDSGLIITNHHCAYDAIQKASTPQNDLLTNGFSAMMREQEISAPDYQVRITENYRDISNDVLAAVQDGMTFLDRTKAIDKRRKELEVAAEKHVQRVLGRANHRFTPAAEERGGAAMGAKVPGLQLYEPERTETADRAESGGPV